MQRFSTFDFTLQFSNRGLQNGTNLRTTVIPNAARSIDARHKGRKTYVAESRSCLSCFKSAAKLSASGLVGTNLSVGDITDEMVGARSVSALFSIVAVTTTADEDTARGVVAVVLSDRSERSDVRRLRFWLFSSKY